MISVRVTFCLALLGVSICLLSSCGSSDNTKTDAALKAASDLVAQNKLQEALGSLAKAINDRIADITPDTKIDPSDIAARKAALQKILSDTEILKLERAEFPIVLNLGDGAATAKLNGDLVSGDPTDHTLADSLTKGTVDARLTAIRAYSVMGDPRTAPALKVALSATENKIRESATVTMGGIHDPAAVDALIPMLNDPDVIVRADAADALGLERDIRAIGPLLDALADKDESVQLAAETSIRLLIIQPGVKEDVFKEHLSGPDPHVALVAATCCLELNDHEVIPTITNLADKTTGRLRLYALKALELAGDPRAISSFRLALDSPDEDIKLVAIEALGTLNDQASSPKLRQMLLANPASLPLKMALYRSIVDLSQNAADNQQPPPTHN